jgi:hypothetical protein
MSIETYQQQEAKQGRLLPVVIISLLAVLLVIGTSSSAHAAERDQAKRIHDRLAGVPPSSSVLDDMETLIASYNASGQTNGDGAAAAALAIGHPDFYRVTLKNFITPWTNEEQTVFAPLNDYTATVIGVIKDDLDFRRILYDNILYTGNGVTPANSTNSNAHYQAMDDQNSDLQTILTLTTQPSAAAAAGIMSTRQGAKAFYVDGTNRAMFRFTLLNHLCIDLEQIKDTSRSPDRVRQDVSRSPGGDSRIYMNACVGCHAGMDPMAQAFAFYDYTYPLLGNGDPDYENGQMAFTNGVVQPKYLINSNNFEFGYVTQHNPPDNPGDSWVNYWRAGPNSVMGWDWAAPGSTSGSGSGASSMGREMANSYAFAQCQVKKVFKNVCLRDPVDEADLNKINGLGGLIENFQASNFNLKQVFAESAVYCRGS